MKACLSRRREQALTACHGNSIGKLGEHVKRQTHEAVTLV